MANIKESSKERPSSKNSVVVSKKVKDYGNDPFFVKKAKAMEAVLKKYALPNSLAYA